MIENQQLTQPAPEMPVNPAESTPPVTPITQPEPIQPVVPPTQQPGFQQVQPATPTPEAAMPSPEATTTNWKAYGLIGVVTLVILGFFGSFAYNQYLLSQQPIALDGVTLAENPLQDASPAPEINYNTPSNVLPPEGPSVLPPVPSPEPVPRLSYVDYQYSFSFEYESNDLYQDVSCSAPTQQRPTSEKKLIFIDTSNIQSNDDLLPYCEPTNTQHKAKILVSETPIECLGDTRIRSAGGVVDAVQCEGKTTSSSSLESSTSLLIPKDGNTIVIEVNSPEYLKLISDVVDTFSLVVGDQPEFTES